MSSARNNDVSGYMNWMIAGVKNNPHEVDALLKAKAKLEETMPDLEVIQGMTNVEYDSIDIPWGLGKWLSHDEDIHEEEVVQGLS